MKSEGRYKKYGMRKLPSVFAAFLLAAGSFGILVTRSIVEVFLCAELISIALFYIFFTAIIPVVFPQRKDAEAIFIGGAGKPPYVSSSELFSPHLTFIPGKAAEEEKHKTVPSAT